MKPQRSVLISALFAVYLLSFVPFAWGEQIKIGTLKFTSAASLFIAQEKGYFSDVGLDPDVMLTDEPVILTQGLVAGDFDFSLVALGGAVFNLAGQGALRIIAGVSQEAPGFQAGVVIASNQAFASGMRSLKDLGGHSFAIVSAGTIPEYDVGLLAEKYHFEFGSLKITALGNLPNMMSAVAGGTIDFTSAPGPYAKPFIANKQVQFLSWMADEIRMQIIVVLASASTTDKKSDLVPRFLTAYRRGIADYRVAFIGPDERPKEGETAPDVYSLLSKRLGQPLNIIKLGVAYMPRDGQVDIQDVLRQIDWYKAHSFVKPDVDGSKIIDTRYVIPMPER
jgi:NitT/TauT family transport system substrate-binding protein